MNLFHPEIDKLLILRSNATPGVWGPTTEAPRDENYKRLAKGPRGAASWGAVVSDDGRPDKDHPRYDDNRYPEFAEEGSDSYGGWLVGESLRDGNGEYIAALHNKLPGLTQTIRNLRAMLLEVGLNPILLDGIIADSMEGNDPS